MNIESVNRFCQLVVQINEANELLNEERASFYYGGYSFEECNSAKIKELEDLRNELVVILKCIKEL